METDLIHRDELRCRAEAWAEDVFAGEPNNCKYNSLMDLIDDSEVVGAADVETEKLIAELRDYFDGKNLNHATAMRAADALESLTAQNAAKDAEIERLKNSNEVLRAERDELHKNNCGLRADRDRLQAELDAAKKCIYDVQTYLDLGSAKYIAATIKQWRGKENGDGKENP